MAWSSTLTGEDYQLYRPLTEACYLVAVSNITYKPKDTYWASGIERYVNSCDDGLPPRPEDSILGRCQANEIFMLSTPPVLFLLRTLV